MRARQCAPAARADTVALWVSWFNLRHAQQHASGMRSGVRVAGPPPLTLTPCGVCVREAIRGMRGASRRRLLRDNAPGQQPRPAAAWSIKNVRMYGRQKGTHFV